MINLFVCLRLERSSRGPRLVRHRNVRLQPPLAQRGRPQDGGRSKEQPPGDNFWFLSAKTKRMECFIAWKYYTYRLKRAIFLVYVDHKNWNFSQPNSMTEENLLVSAGGRKISPPMAAILSEASRIRYQYCFIAIIE